MAGKTARKSGKATASPGVVGGKNIQKIKQQTAKKYGKTTTAKIPKSARRFSLASDSSLSSVSEDERNFHNVPVFDTSSDEEEKNVEMNAIMGPSSSSESDSDDDDDDDMSSEDDSDVDFVALTKEKKARAIKAAKSRKNPRKTNASKKYPKPTVKTELVEFKNKDGDDGDKDEVVTEFDFQFQFDSYGNETFKIGAKNDDDDDEEGKKNEIEDSKLQQDEEDLGEEIPETEFKLMDNSYDATVLSEINLLKNHLMMDVPKIKEDEINSDEDYEIDDAKLIATLQNDNDDLELAMDDDEDDDSEPGEELLDANEFDNLSFEGEEDIDDYDELIENAEDDLNEDDENYLLKEETNAITKEFDSPQTIRLKAIDDEEDEEEDGFLKYLSEDSILFDNDNDEVEKKLVSDFDEENYELTFFNMPFKDQDSSATSSRRHKISKRKFSVNSDSRNEFHWPYVKKSENEYDDDDDSSFNSSSEEESDEDDDNDEIHLKAITEQQLHSGDSTDEDTSLPKKMNKKANGNKMVAKEVLSTSETAPPLLGKWKTSENNKPFGIIDGLSTRSLQPESHILPFATGSNGQLKKPRSTSMSYQKSKLNPASSASAADEPMAIDDLLNMSGLEDEEEITNEVDNVGFIFGKKIPLSAFRNKGYVPTVVDSMEQLKKYSMNNSNKRLVNKLDIAENLKTNTTSGAHHHHHKKHVKFENGSLVKKTRKNKKEKKLNKLRKQSIVEAAKEGLRTTKSGLFSENTIADVEAFLADVDTGDEFSILFRGVI